MVLRPIGLSASRRGEVLPAWVAVEEAQRQASSELWLISQPDHAELAGELARTITASWMPFLAPDVIQAIAMHDDGWRSFDAEAVSSDHRPLSFIDATPADFVQAWAGSIESAARSSARGGLIVSRHFCRLAEHRLAVCPNSDDDQLRVQEFLVQERARAQRLDFDLSPEIELLTDVLQFCDLLSLYLCCGATVGVEFPQHFAGHVIRASCDAASASELRTIRLEPSPLGAGLSAAIPARRWPGTARAALPLLIS